MHHLKITITYLLFGIVASCLTYMIINSIWEYTFVNIMHECIVDEYWVDCFGPVTKSAMIAGLSGLVVMLISIYLLIRRVVVK